MRSSYLKGLITGTVLAASVSMCLGPRRRRALDRQKGIVGRTRRAKAAAGRFAKDLSRTVSELVQ